MVFACGVFLYTIIIEEQFISESVDHGEIAVSTCFDQYLDSIKTIGESFDTDISLQLKNHVEDVVDDAEAKAHVAATAAERMHFMAGIETNSWHGTPMLPVFSWMVLGQLEDQQDPEDTVVADIVIAGRFSTEEFNNWVWFGLKERNPSPALGCDFYCYRNASNLSSSFWCVEDLFDNPDQPSPSIYPHPYSPAIVKLQNATPCDATHLATPGTPRPLTWMPFNFFVWTYNVVALTSVVGGVYGSDGSCQGLSAANVRFTSMSKYLTSLVDSARYENLSIVLIETGSEKILGTSFGVAIYKETQTRSDISTVAQELPASLAQMEDPLARTLNLYIEESYGSIANISTPLITSATLEGQEYFLSFDTFSRPMLNLIICAFLPHVSITGPTEHQHLDAQISFEASADEMSAERNHQLIIVIVIAVAGLLICAVVAFLTTVCLSLRIKALMNLMKKVHS